MTPRRPTMAAGAFVQSIILFDVIADLQVGWGVRFAVRYSDEPEGVCLDEKLPRAVCKSLCSR